MVIALLSKRSCSYWVAFSAHCLSQRLPERLRVSMTSIFGLASLGIGILLVVKCANLPAMVLATLLGALIGEICLLEKGVKTSRQSTKSVSSLT